MGAAALPTAALLARLGREVCRAPGVKTAEERVGVREPELLKLEHRTGARGLGVSRAVCDDQRVLRGVFRPRLDPLVRHVDGASYDHVAADASACIEDDRFLARVSTLLHLLGRDPADDSGLEGTRRVLGAKRCGQAARERGRDDHTSDDRDHWEASMTGSSVRSTDAPPSRALYDGGPAGAPGRLLREPAPAATSADGTPRGDRGARTPPRHRAGRPPAPPRGTARTSP